MTGKGRRAALLIALALSPCRAGAPAAAAHPRWTRAQTVTVAMVDYSFIPDHLKLRAGVPYRLHFVNRSSEWHEFTAPRFFKTVILGNPRALTPDLAVAPGKSGNLLFLAPRPGHFRFWCADHDWAGMDGTIAVR